MTADGAYLPIGDYAVIGDLHTAVLVGRNGSIDWACFPRFDSPSVFGALLDPQRGGHWQVAPAVPSTNEQRYLPATNVLETAFHAEGGGVVQVTDFMPVGPARDGRTELHRRVHCPRGPVEIAITFAPQFDYALRPTMLHRRRFGILATDADDDAAALSTSGELPWELTAGGATARLRLGSGDVLWLVLRFDEDDVLPVEHYESQRKLEETTRWWDAWTSKLRYKGPYRLEVERSALALKLCAYEPSGAIVAAPTTSLPESPGGSRNWDYRFAWLRDSAFVLDALLQLDYHHEADRFVQFLKRVCRHTARPHVQILYAVDGRRDLPERELSHLAGYRGAAPVRIGNAAAGQRQLDVYGETLDTLAMWARHHAMTEGTWKTIVELVEWTAAHWREPDFSIWEARQEPRHYVFSKVMAWTALRRGADLATGLDHPALAARWNTAAEAVHAEVLDCGWDGARGTFVQVYGEPQLDAALLIIPEIGFLPGTDPRVRGTLAAVRRELATSCEDLLYRYRAADGLAGAEGAFVACSFWMVQNLALAGDWGEADRVFRLLLRRSNHVGLLAEEIDPATGEQLGNFPLALSHAALINTACLLETLRPAAPPVDVPPSGVAAPL